MVPAASYNIINLGTDRVLANTCIIMIRELWGLEGQPATAFNWYYRIALIIGRPTEWKLKTNTHNVTVRILFTMLT